MLATASLAWMLRNELWRETLSECYRTTAFAPTHLRERLTSTPLSPTIRRGITTQHTTRHVRGGPMRIRKAVLPVAGLGTRVLPASKVTPKEMLPIVDKPTLQYIVEEAVAAGVEEIIFVTSRSKRSIEDHFDVFPELEMALERKGKRKELEELRRLQKLATYTYVRQPEPLGLGHAVLCAKALVGNEPFIVMLGDDLVDPETPCLPRMIDVHEQYAGSVLSLFQSPPEQISSLGIVSVEDVGPDVVKVTHLVEKPSLE